MSDPNFGKFRYLILGLESSIYHCVIVSWYISVDLPEKYPLYLMRKLLTSFPGERSCCRDGCQPARDLTFMSTSSTDLIRSYIINLSSINFQSNNSAYWQGRSKGLKSRTVLSFIPAIVITSSLPTLYPSQPTIYFLKCKVEM